MKHVEATQTTPNTRVGRVGRHVTGGWIPLQVFIEKIPPRHGRTGCNARCGRCTVCTAGPEDTGDFPE
jgi:hypothetical protein